VTAKLLQSPIGRVRLLGWIEGVSYVLLMFIAMPMKYLAGQPLMVEIVGWIHGGLFIGLALLVAITWLLRQLTFGLSVLVMVAALLPFGPFVIDRWLQRAESRS
jgi:integral membrane protein